MARITHANGNGSGEPRVAPASKPGGELNGKARPGAVVGAPQTIPYDEDMERDVLGCAIVNGDALRLAAEKLKPEDFYAPPHRAVFGAIKGLAGRGDGKVDRALVCNELKRNGELEAVGGKQFVLGLVDGVPRAANVHLYVDVVLNDAVKRRVLDVTSRVRDFCSDASVSGSDVLARADGMLSEVSADAVVTEPRGYDELAFEVLEQVQAAHEGKTEPGVSTGLKDLDGKLGGGLKPKKLYLAGGRPGMGKSALAGNVAWEAAGDSRRPQEEDAVVIFSMEMGEEEIMHRHISALTRISSDRLGSGELKPEEWTKVVRAFGEAANRQIYVDESTNLTVADIRARTRRTRQKMRRRGQKLSLVIVDYLQLIRGDGGYGKKENRNQELTDIANGLKNIAKDFGVAVLAVAQLNRASEARQDKRPLLSELRDSGGLEQAADVVMLLYRDEYYYPETTDRLGEAEINVAKQRGGQTGTVRTTWVGSTTRFLDLARSGQVP